MNAYGKELILDLHGCDTPYSRKDIENYMNALCDLIDMNQEDLHFWDYEGDPKGYNNAPPHLKGISAVQFIKTSNITIHTLDDLKKVFINIFSCKDFDIDKAGKLSERWFSGEILNWQIVERL